MENEIKSRWIDIIQYLKTEYNVSEVSFKTWLLNINLYSVDEANDLAIILVNDNIGENGLNFIKEKYGLFLKTSIAELTGYVLNHLLTVNTILCIYTVVQVLVRLILYTQLPIIYLRIHLNSKYFTLQVSSILMKS